MIRSFRNKALKRFWERDDVSKLPADRLKRIEFILDRLDAAVEPNAMVLPGLGFHQLSGNQKGRYAVSVSANWRITFAFDEQDTIEIDLEDYH